MPLISPSISGSRRYLHSSNAWSRAPTLTEKNSCTPVSIPVSACQDALRWVPIAGCW